ncbi:DUF4012 domain-containing protein [Demequina sp. NBRC 110057]|uniref:DUF4012 domain-containing protein n=1 Tax=Demequina sp. NBRC 110057 TaxID=1570346 RepID=UPI000A010D7F|nr:DUF4012 domain-containing protein [Demequina sp. NBRC 110057]
MVPNLVAREPRTKSPRRRWVGAALGLGVAVIIGVTAYDGYRAAVATADLEARASALSDAVEARDEGSLLEAVEGLQESAQQFDAAVHGPHWWVAARVPWLGDQVVPLQRASQAVRAIADDAAVPLVDAGGLALLESPAVVNGRVDPDALEPYRDVLAAAAAVLDEQATVLAATELDSTLARVRLPFERLSGEVSEVASLVDAAHATAEVLPAVLGGEGPRQYVVMIQNNAEPRTSGGIPGAVMGLTVDDGRFSVGEYVAAASMADTSQDVAALTEDERRIFSARMARFPQDVNFTPDFSRAAQLMAAFWKRETGVQPDGVVSVDPVALEYMLAGMTPFSIGDIQMSSETVARVMLSEVYWQYPTNEGSDAFFAMAGRALFDTLMSGETAVIDGAARAVGEQRLLVWSAHEDEQDILRGLPLAASWRDEPDALGVFINDGSGSKIGYYLRNDVSVSELVCGDGELSGQDVTIRLSHTYDGDVTELPKYVSGAGEYVPEGDMQVNVLVYPPTGLVLASAQEDDAMASLNSESHDGRLVLSTTVTLSPGESVVLSYGLTATTADLRRGDVVVTPGAHADTPTVRRGVSQGRC